MKVLIKEYSITFRMIFFNFFHKLNFEIMFLDDNHRLLEILAEHSFDLYVFSSIEEKEIVSLISTIREYENKISAPNRPILFCASNLELQRKLEYLNLGVTCFLKKPFSLESLKNLLEMVIPNFKTWTDINVLIAEDSEPTQKILKIYLSKHKLKMTFAFDGQEALEILANQSENFHLLITDINMPNINGFELAKIIRYALGLFEIPIVFLSGENEIMNSQDFLSLGNGWIQKPFSAEIVNQIVPYLEKAKQYKYQQIGKRQNQFIQNLYNHVEDSCPVSLNLGFILELIDEISKNTQSNEESFILMKKNISELQQNFSVFRAFLLENAHHFEFSNTVRPKQTYHRIHDSLKTVIEHKQLQVLFKTEISSAILKTNSIVFEFTFLEILTSFILSLKEKQKLFIRVYLEENFLCLEFITHDVLIKNFPNWILDKTKFFFSVKEEAENKIYLLKFEFDLNNDSTSKSKLL